MGFDMFFHAVNKEKNIKLELLGFGTRSMSPVFDRLKDFFELDGEKFIDECGNEYDNEGYFWKIKDWKGFKSWLSEVNKVNEIFAGVSSRKIENDEYSDEVRDKFWDLCYDLGIEPDSWNIYSLMRLAAFGVMLNSGEMFDDGRYGTWQGWTLIMEGSW